MFIRLDRPVPPSPPFRKRGAGCAGGLISGRPADRPLLPTGGSLLF